jgi:hypothetical protein
MVDFLPEHDELPVTEFLRYDIGWLKMFIGTKNHFQNKDCLPKQAALKSETKGGY